ncbi:Uncharacterized protein TCM_017222 [Theobroma cacao]|uniref:Uncharacterized protein n=1 Tax=Theobroma cacao TaxID=3641 RepID=A0A061EEJ0_THECC|nr:Uncharacterized protein TCM_017222 [Theobroma cacao]
MLFMRLDNTKCHGDTDSDLIKLNSWPLLKVVKCVNSSRVDNALLAAGGNATSWAKDDNKVHWHLRNAMNNLGFDQKNKIYTIQQLVEKFCSDPAWCSVFGWEFADFCL